MSKGTEQSPGPAWTAFVEGVARHMFQRQADSYDSEPALVELAWLDPEIRRFWIDEAASVLVYVRSLSAEKHAGLSGV